MIVLLLANPFAEAIASLQKLVIKLEGVKSMLHKSSISHSSQQLPTSLSLQNSDLDVASLQEIAVKLDESSEEALSGGAIALPSFLNQANKAKQAEILASQRFYL